MLQKNQFLLLLQRNNKPLWEQEFSIDKHFESNLPFKAEKNDWAIRNHIFLFLLTYKLFYQERKICTR